MHLLRVTPEVATEFADDGNRRPTDGYLETLFPLDFRFRSTTAKHPRRYFKCSASQSLGGDYNL